MGREVETMKGRSLLLSLKKMKWSTISRTYGNCHSTLIGLLVDWWISMSPKHWSLEGGPTNGFKKKGVRGQCDALFGFKEKAVGILEVEGTRHEIAGHKIGTFFDAKREEYTDLQFAIILFYSYEAYGKGNNRNFVDPIVHEAMNQIIKVSKKHIHKDILILSIKKKYNKQYVGIRSWNEYYMGEIDKIEGKLFTNGKETYKLTLF